MAPARDNETGSLVFGMYELPDTESVYWLAPEHYVGNILKSYGSNLEYMLSWVNIEQDTRMSAMPPFSTIYINLGYCAGRYKW